MVGTRVEDKIEAHLYRRSIFDRFFQWIEELPVREWVFYAAFGLALILIQLLFLWLDGGLEADELLPIIIFNGLLTPFALALIHYLDNQAASALDTIRPVLDLPESEINRYAYRLTIMPFLAPLAAGLIMLVVVILMEQVTEEPFRYAALDQLPVFSVVFYIVDKSSAFLFGVVIYHTIRQLRLVNTINSNHIRVDLFNLRPLQAFSRLTASTAVGLVIGVYGWMLINPELLSIGINMAAVLFFTILAGAVFAWPLVGAHRLMQMEKERVLHDIDRQFERLFVSFNQRLRDEDYAGAERLNGAIASLDIQHRRINAIPTWPWRPETLRSVLTAIAIPLVLSVLQLLVERAMGG